MGGSRFPAAHSGAHREIVRWSLSAASAGLAHAAVLASFFIDMPFSRPVSSSAPMVVELAPTPLSLVAPPTQQPPGPQQVESKKIRAVTPRVKLPFQPPPESATPSEVLVQEQRDERPDELPEKDRAVAVTTAMPSAAVAPDQMVPAAPEEGASTADSSTMEQTWENQILATMERNKRYPGPAQRRRQEDIVYVRFAIDRNGNVLESRIERSHGYSLLDEEVLALLQRSSPLPAPPDQVSGERVEIVVPVEFFMRGRKLNRALASSR